MENKKVTFENLPQAVEVLTETINGLTETVNSLKEANNEPKQETEKLLTIKQASEFLSLTVPTLYTKISRNELPYMKRGKRVYFSNKDLLNFFKSSRNKTNKELEQEAKDYTNKKGLK